MNANFYGGVDGEGQDGAAPGKGPLPPERGQTHHRKRTLGPEGWSGGLNRSGEVDGRSGLSLDGCPCSTVGVGDLVLCTVCMHQGRCHFTKWWRSQVGFRADTEFDY